jgi:hypothetical protein
VVQPPQTREGDGRLAKTAERHGLEPIVVRE